MDKVLTDIDKRIAKRESDIQNLWQNVQEKLPEIDAMVEKMEDEAHQEYVFYRYYHHSFKVYYAQEYTQEMRDLLDSLSPNELHPFYLDIFHEGCRGEKWQRKHNYAWGYNCRSFVEAFAHTLFFLKMISKYGHKYKEVPNLLDEGMAAILTLYRLR